MTIVNTAMHDNACVVVVDDEHLTDDRRLRLLFDEIAAQADGSKKHLLLDLQLVQMCASAGLNMLIRLRNRCVQNGMTLHLCDLRPVVEEVIDQTKLRDLFRIHATVADGLREI